MKAIHDIAYTPFGALRRPILFIMMVCMCLLGMWAYLAILSTELPRGYIGSKSSAIGFEGASCHEFVLTAVAPFFHEPSSLSKTQIV